MVHIPDEEESKMIIKLNEANAKIMQGLKDMYAALPEQDGELDIHIYRIGKTIESVSKRVYTILEQRYIDKEFNDITEDKKDKE